MKPANEGTTKMFFLVKILVCKIYDLYPRRIGEPVVAIIKGGMK
jgi:hypothetical protein